MNKSRGAMLRENFDGIRWTLGKFFGYYPVLARLAVFCILFTAAVSAVPSLFVQNILTVVEKWYQSGDWASARAEILPYIYLLIGLYVLSLISQTLETQIMAVMTQAPRWATSTPTRPAIS